MIDFNWEVLATATPAQAHLLRNLLQDHGIDAQLDDTDSVQILLDTFNDGQNAFIFGTSPTGIEFDGQVSKAGQERGGGGGPARAGGQGGAQRAGAAAFNLNWDAVWNVRSQITARGWESEFRIPFRTLRYQPGPDKTWGVNISRNLRRRNEQTFWSPVSRAFLFTQISLAGDLEGLETTTQRNLKLLPYVVGGFSTDYSRVENQSRFERDVGVDLKYSLTPGLTLDATVNTDFAQAEVDERALRIVEIVRPKLVADGMFLVGLDIVGDKLMEINVFSPGGLGSAQTFEGVNFATAVIMALERKVQYMGYYQRNFNNIDMATL